jgi:DNA-binding NarL/FixJ family response regulator
MPASPGGPAVTSPGEQERRGTALRIVVADDAPLFRDAVAGVLEAGGFVVVARVGDPAALCAAVAATRPAVAVVDIRMPPTHRLEGLHAATQIRRDHPDVGVLLLSQYLESYYPIALFGADARGVGYLLKDRVNGAAELVDAVRTIAGDGCVLDPNVVALMMGGRHRAIGALSDRERQVLALMAEGLSNRAIEKRLVLTTKTVESHVRNIFTRLGLPPEDDSNRRVLAVLTFLQSGAAPGSR